jgi:hypothetical protein
MSELAPESTDFDPTNIRVNFSEEEASSEARDFDPIPSGKYHCAVTGIETRFCGPESKNPGKPFWAVEMTVQNGPYENRKLWGNVMLFEGALYSLSQLLKATGFEQALETGEIPAPDEIQGEELVVNVQKQRDKYREDRGDAAPGERLFKNEVKGYKPLSAGTGSSGGSSDDSESMLP